MNIHNAFLYGDLVQVNVLVYVDDCLISSNDFVALIYFEDNLNSFFHMKDLGHQKYFLGIVVACSHLAIIQSQRKCTLDNILAISLLRAKRPSNLIEKKHKLAHSISPLLSYHEPYSILEGPP